MKYILWTLYYTDAIISIYLYTYLFICIQTFLEYLNIIFIDIFYFCILYTVQCTCNCLVAILYYQFYYNDYYLLFSGTTMILITVIIYFFKIIVGLLSKWLVILEPWQNNEWITIWWVMRRLLVGTFVCMRNGTTNYYWRVKQVVELSDNEVLWEYCIIEAVITYMILTSMTDMLLISLLSLYHPNSIIIIPIMLNFIADSWQQFGCMDNQHSARFRQLSSRIVNNPNWTADANQHRRYVRHGTT